jgi:hypothetical protein
MRHAPLIFQRHFRRRYLNALVDLDRITVDDLAADALCQVNSQTAFAGSRGTNYGNEAGSTDISGSADILSTFCSLFPGFG